MTANPDEAADHPSDRAELLRDILDKFRKQCLHKKGGGIGFEDAVWQIEKLFTQELRRAEVAAYKRALQVLPNVAMSNDNLTSAELRVKLRQAIDDGILTHTGRSVGDRASDEVAGDIMQLFTQELRRVTDIDSIDPTDEFYLDLVDKAVESINEKLGK